METQTYDVEIQVPNGPDKVEWDLFDIYFRWSKAFDKAQEFASRGYSVRIVRSDGVLVFEA